MLDKLNTLVTQRATIWDGEMKPLVELDEMTPDQAQTYDEAERKLDEVEAEIARVERAITHDAETRAAAERRAELLSFAQGNEVSTEEVEDKDARYSEVFKNYIVRGFAGLSQEDRDIISTYRVDSVEDRALTAGTGATGGFTVPEGFMNKLVEAQLAFGGIRNAPITKITTTSGNDIPVPTGDDTGNTGELLGENVTATEADPTFGQVTLNSYIWSSKLVRVPFTLLQDGAFNMDTWLPAKLGQRIGRVQAGYLITGTGTAQPEGIMTNVTTGHTTASAQVASFIYDDFVAIEHSIDPAYRTGGAYLLSDLALKQVRLVKDLNGYPIFQPGLAAGPSTINGYSFTVDQNMATPAATTKPVVFGDLSGYWLRDVAGAIVMRLDERYAEYGQVAFLAWTRMDAKPVTAGDDPYKCITMVAS